MTKKVYMVIAQKDFRDEELIEPKKILEDNKYQVIVLSPEGGICKGMLGLEISADKNIRDAEIDSDTIAVTVVGGNNSPSLMNYPELGELLSEAKRKKLIIGAICLAPMVVASFGIIDHMSATVYPTSESIDMLKNHNILYVPENVVVDEWLVTGNGPSSAQAYGEALVETLKEYSK